MSAEIKVESPPNVDEFVDPDLLARCLDAFKEASGGAAATVKLTEDFDADVGRASAHEPRAVEYRSDRGALGVVGGRTILRPDGESEVYFNLGAFRDLKDDEAVVSLFQHEGFHVAIDSRGESLWSRTTSADAQLPEEPHEHCFQAAAAACDEYRVDFGVARDDRSVDDFLDFADSCEILIAGASLQYEYDHRDVGKVWAAVTEPFNALVIQAGHLAAMCSRDPSRTIPRRGLLVTSDCMDLISTLQRLPPADQPAGEAELFEILQEAAGIVDRWMRKVGFAVELVDGNLYFRVLKPEIWIERGLELARGAQEQAGS
jgi:hypothetical protein